MALLMLGGILVLGAGLVKLRAFAFHGGPGVLVCESPSLEWRPLPGTDAAPPKQADIQFALRNTGWSPVRVVNVESGCGCARPVVRPSIIESGRSGVVEVHANVPLVGEKTVPIVLHTDSPRTPEVSLRLRLMGIRRPPFLLQAAGDLTYLGEDFTGETRTSSPSPWNRPDGPTALPAAKPTCPSWRSTPLVLWWRRR